MLKENLVMLRGIHGFSQEEIAEKIGISRQAYAKWETGATVPDIEKCNLLASVYGISIDSLINLESKDEVAAPPLPPTGKKIWGTISINDRGQIVIPKGARDQFGWVGGTRILVLSDDDGIALIKVERFEENIRALMELTSKIGEKE